VKVKLRKTDTVIKLSLLHVVTMPLREAIFEHSRYEFLQQKPYENAIQIFVNKKNVMVQVFTEEQH
jgi:hypothetical protein